MSIVKRALSLAFSAHEGQYRKYHDNVPYIQHPLRVAFSVSKATSGQEIAVAAALLHDVLEDTEVPPEAISEACGNEVLHLVQELTNPSKNPEHAKKKREERKRIDREHLKQVSYAARVIKLCDRIDNLNDVANAPRDFQILYAKESVLLLEAIESVSYIDSNLVFEFKEAIAKLGV